MSLDRFNDDCTGCRPALFDVQTGESLPAGDPIMKAINRMWDTDTTRAQREAWHAFCCHNSREPHVMILVDQVTAKIQAAISALEKKP